MKKHLLLYIQFMLMLLFGYAAFSKLADHALFQAQLKDFPVIGNYAVFFSWFIPVAELLTLVLLFIPRFGNIGFYAAACLLTVFTLFLVCMLSLYQTLPCSCGGLLVKLSWRQHLVFNLFFLLVSVTGIWLQSGQDEIVTIRKHKIIDNFP